MPKPVNWDISLLWPEGYGHNPGAAYHTLSESAAADLDLNTTIAAISEPYSYRGAVRAALTTLCTDPAVIRYRQDVLQDLLDNPALATDLADLLPAIAALDSLGYVEQPGQSPLHEVAWRVGQLEAYAEVVAGLQAAFERVQHSLAADGLQRLRAMTTTIAADDTFQRLLDQLPDLTRQVRNIASITIGVNLDDRLRPVEATLLAVNDQKFRGESMTLLASLFGRAPENEWEGIAPLHSAGPKRTLPQAHHTDAENPLLYPLFRDLAMVMKRATRPVISALQRYVRVNVGLLSGLAAELAFFLGAADLVRDLRAGGLPLCRPEIAPLDARVCDVAAAYNFNLALRVRSRTEVRSPAENGAFAREVVPNDLTFSAEAGRIFVLTGPNQGGKTTYTQAAGLVQVLAQAGLHVPGQRACISPVDGIFTHFPVEERPSAEAGRLGEEAQRLNAIFRRATPHSLVLLNESLSSTSPGEGLYLARDMVRVLRRLGVRAIYATHLHELAAGVDDLNADTPGDSRVGSLVSLVRENGSRDVARTFRIVPGPPMGRSYARDLAARYGISYDQLCDLLRARGLLDGE